MALSRDAGAAPPVRTDVISAAEEITLALPAQAAGMRFDRALAQSLPQYSRSRLRAWIDAGRVTLDERIVDANRKVHGGEAVRVRPLADPSETPFTAEPIALDIVDDTAGSKIRSLIRTATMQLGYSFIACRRRSWAVRISPRRK